MRWKPEVNAFAITSAGRITPSATNGNTNHAPRQLNRRI